MRLQHQVEVIDADAHMIAADAHMIAAGLSVYKEWAHDASL